MTFSQSSRVVYISNADLIKPVDTKISANIFKMFHLGGKYDIKKYFNLCWKETFTSFISSTNA